MTVLTGVRRYGGVSESLRAVSIYVPDLNVYEWYVWANGNLFPPYKIKKIIM